MGIAVMRKHRGCGFMQGCRSASSNASQTLNACTASSVAVASFCIGRALAFAVAGLAAALRVADALAFACCDEPITVAALVAEPTGPLPLVACCGREPCGANARTSAT